MKIKPISALCSIIETARANGFIPFDYLRHLLQTIAQNAEDIDALLPWKFDLAELAVA